MRTAQFSLQPLGSSCWRAHTQRQGPHTGVGVSWPPPWLLPFPFSSFSPSSVSVPYCWTKALHTRFLPQKLTLKTCVKEHESEGLVCHFSTFLTYPFILKMRTGMALIEDCLSRMRFTYANQHCLPSRY